MKTALQQTIETLNRLGQAAQDCITCEKKTLCDADICVYRNENTNTLMCMKEEYKRMSNEIESLKKHADRFME